MSDIILKADRVLVGEDLNLKEHMAAILYILTVRK